MMKLFLKFKELILLAFTSLLRFLVKAKVLRSHYRIDIDGDGKTDVDLKIHSGTEEIPKQDSSKTRK